MKSVKQIGRVKITTVSGKPRLVREVVVGNHYKEELAIPQPKEKMLQRAIHQSALKNQSEKEFNITKEIEQWLKQQEVNWL